MRRRASQKTEGAAKASLLVFAFAIASLLFPAAGLAAPPTIAETSVSSVTTTSATLKASINPNEKATLYHFEYGPQDCAVGPCMSIPVPDGEIAKGNAAVAVETKVEGLAPASIYHFRVIAKSFGAGGGETPGPDRTFATYALPPSFDPCPNDALRTEHPSAKLPDCRAYEQASPVAKNGLDIMGMTSYFKASVEGDKVSFLTTNGVPGGEGAQEFPPYLASRGPNGWSTQGLLPPATLGSEARLRGWTPDFSQVFDLVQRFGIPDDAFLARSSADGSLTTIFPYGRLGRPSYVGASADGSEVFFQADGNVYLWENGSGEVILASVFNDGTTPPAGAVAGPYDFLEGEPAKGGGLRGNYYTQDNHAIASDGSLYFTAEGTGQLYLRRNPGKAQSPMEGDQCLDPALACTISVSESRRSEPDPFGQRAAAFMTATPDGSKAYFTSGEELTYDANTGPEAAPPAIVRSDFEGNSVEDDFLPTSAAGIAVDGEYVYWANPIKGTIGRATIEGEDPDPTFIEIPPLKVGPEEKEVPAKPQYVALDAGHVYWSSEGEGKAAEGAIGRADIDGDLNSIEAEWIGGISRPMGIALNSEFIYWAQAGEEFSNEGAIGRADKSDGGGLISDFVPDIGGTERPQGVAVDASHIYWTMNDPANGTFGSLRQNDLSDGGNRIGMFIAAKAEVRGIAVDSGHIYWAGQGAEAIGRVPIADFAQGSCEAIPGCEPEFIKAEGRPTGLALDAEHLYWSVNGETPPHPGNDLYRFDAETGDLTDLTPDPIAENGAEVQGVLGASEDGSYLYFAANGDLDGAGQATGGDCEFKGLNGEGWILTSGSCSLYLLHAGQTHFIARLDAEGDDTESDATDWIPKGRGGATLAQAEKTARVSADGHVLIFRSKAKLSDYDNEGVPMLYRYDADRDQILCLSCDPTGAPPSGIGPRDARVPALEPVEVAHVLSRIASPDGERVFFQTTDPLVQEDVNGEEGCPIVGTSKQAFPSCQDVYEWEAKGTGSCESEAQNGGCLYLLSGGKESSPSFFVDASASGDDAFLLTRARLVGQDQDQLFDIYDARAGGGFGSQNEVPKVPCEAEACKPAGSVQPQGQSPGSASFSGPGNPPGKTKPRCPRKKGRASASKTKAKSRCGAKHRKHRKRGANAKGRTNR